MPIRFFSTTTDGRVFAGVCAGIAEELGVDPTLVRLIFALLALAGGAGILLYFALWAWSAADRPWWALLLLFGATTGLLEAVGFPQRGVWGLMCAAGGLALALRDGGSFRPGAPLS